LMGKGLQVSQIGDKVGFSSATYFSSCFKTEYGKTVKQFEQQLRV
jgi:AraC-like DNA-binding protein